MEETTFSHLKIRYEKEDEDELNVWKKWISDIDTNTRNFAKGNIFVEAVRIPQNNYLIMATKGHGVFLFIQDGNTGSTKHDCDFKDIKSVSFDDIKNIKDRFDDMRKGRSIANKKALEKMAGKVIVETKLSEANFLKNDDTGRKHVSKKYSFTDKYIK